MLPAYAQLATIEDLNRNRGFSTHSLIALLDRFGNLLNQDDRKHPDTQ
jgi:hypothetical protein